MNFRRIGPNSAESETGVRVERIGRSDLRYSINGKSLIVEVELGDGLAVYVSTVTTWQPPHDGGALNAVERAALIANISEALVFLDVDFVIA